MNNLSRISTFNSKFYGRLKLFNDFLSKSNTLNSYILILTSILLTTIIININYADFLPLETVLIEVCPFLSIFFKIFDLKFLNFEPHSYNTNFIYAVILFPIIIIITKTVIYYFKYKQNKFKSETLELARTVHDLKNSLFSIAGYAEIGNTEKVKEKVYEICNELNNSDFMVYENTVNISINKLIETKKSITDMLNIEFNYDVDKIKYSRITSNDFCILIGNILDNAIEACKKIYNPDDRFINLEVKQFQDKLEIMIENSIISSSKTNMKTNKFNKIMHGHGLKSVNKIINKYCGEIKNTIDNNIFLIEIFFPVI